LRVKLMALLCVAPATTTEGESSSAGYGAVSLRRSINYRLLGCKQGAQVEDRCAVAPDLSASHTVPVRSPIVAKRG
jgi:hypothetical protein